MPCPATNELVAPVLVLSIISQPVEQADEFILIPPAPVTFILSNLI